MKKPTLMIDMDDTIADFGSGCTDEEKMEYSPESMWEDNFFMRLKPMAGAIGAVKKLWKSGLFEIYICSVPVVGLHESYSDKSAWISRYFPYLHDRIILIQNKSLLTYDYMIDDTEKWRDCATIQGINPKASRKANQRYHWHKIAEDLIEHESKRMHLVYKNEASGGSISLDSDAAKIWAMEQERAKGVHPIHKLRGKSLDIIKADESGNIDWKDILENHVTKESK